MAIADIEKEDLDNEQDHHHTDHSIDLDLKEVLKKVAELDQKIKNFHKPLTLTDIEPETVKDITVSMSQDTDFVIQGKLWSI